MTDQTLATPKATEQERHTMQIDNMRYFKAPDVVDLGVSETKLEAQIEKERAAYLVRRSKLESASSRLDKLRKTLAALNEQSKASDKAWRLDFVKGFGEQSKSVREQLKQKAQWSVEAEQTQEMITLLEPQVEWLQMHTHAARKVLQKTVKLWHELSSHNALMDSLKELSTSEGMAALSAEVPTLFKRIKEDTYNDDLFMVGLGFDVSFKRGSGIASQLSKEDTIQVNHKIRDRQYAALGELLVSVLPTVEKPVTPTAQLPERLSCEADSSEYPFNLAFSRRLKELEAQMEFVPNLEDLDAA